MNQEQINEQFAAELLEQAAIRRSQAVNDAIDRDRLERATGRQDGVGDLSVTGATLRPGS